MKERKIDILYFNKIKKFRSVKNPNKRMKKQATHWKKTLVNHILTKVFKIYKGQLKLNSKRANNPNEICKRHKETFH